MKPEVSEGDAAAATEVAAAAASNEAVEGRRQLATMMAGAAKVAPTRPKYMVLALYVFALCGMDSQDS